MPLLIQGGELCNCCIKGIGAVAAMVVYLCVPTPGPSEEGNWE
jgi:hypothetical protein